MIALEFLKSELANFDLGLTRKIDGREEIDFLLEIRK